MDITAAPGTSSAKPQQTVAMISSKDLVRVWPSALQIMQEHPRGILDRHQVEEIYQMIASNQWQLWVGVEDGEVELVGICRVESYLHEQVYRLVYVGGALMRFQPGALQTIEMFASFIGAHRVAYDTSRSVVRLLRKTGYAERSVEMSKDVKVLWRDSYGQ